MTSTDVWDLGAASTSDNVGVYIGVPEEAKVTMMDALGAERVYNDIGRRTVSRKYCDDTVMTLMIL
ncbi:uncharacterized protein G2W53_034130 [Senna tora]|uniref:Uncharacterized protein n=1 Tax=Senna tora TaxID=362788 RepID=A0A834WDH6_9FABA|nr:uncharacterized protein G2W53_034130 [Senna tora]